MSNGSYSGTGLTQGPFSLSQGTTLSLNDPADYTQDSTSLQLQNNSGFTLVVQSAGATYNIMPFFAQTIPTLGGGQTITVVPNNPIQSAGNQTGALTAVWMLPGQSPPIQDGALTPIIINSREQAPSSTTVVGTTYTYTYPLQATDQSQEYLFFPAGGFGYTLTYSITGLTSNHVYASGSLTVSGTGSTPLGPFQAFGSIDTAVIAKFVSPSAVPQVEIVLFTSALNSFVSNALSSPLYVTGTPGQPVDVVQYGGLQYVQTSSSSSAIWIGFLSAPPTGYVYRLHQFIVTVPAGTSGTYTYKLGYASGSYQLAALIYPNQASVFLGGQLAANALSVYQNSSGVNTTFALTYDTVLSPSIS